MIRLKAGAPNFSETSQCISISFFQPLQFLICFSRKRGQNSNLTKGSKKPRVDPVGPEKFQEHHPLHWQILTAEILLGLCRYFEGPANRQITVLDIDMLLLKWSLWMEVIL